MNIILKLNNEEYINLYYLLRPLEDGNNKVLSTIFKKMEVLK